MIQHMRLLACIARHLNVNTEQSEDGPPQHTKQPLLLVLEPLLPILDSLTEFNAAIPEIVEVSL